MWPNDVKKSDLRIEYYRASGPGGQHKNKKDTACRITHKPTGISAYATDSKSQSQNRKKAFRKLANKLIPLMKGAAVAQEKSNETIRTYHEIRDSVKDHRTGTVANYGSVINGDLDDLMEDYRKHEMSIQKVGEEA